MEHSIHVYLRNISHLHPDPRLSPLLPHFASVSDTSMQLSRLCVCKTPAVCESVRDDQSECLTHPSGVRRAWSRCLTQVQWRLAVIFSPGGSDHKWTVLSAGAHTCTWGVICTCSVTPPCKVHGASHLYILSHLSSYLDVELSSPPVVGSPGSVRNSLRLFPNCENVSCSHIRN